MNDGTYEGILNQDDVQEYFNGDDARPFYPERAERITRERTHYDGCYRVHPECALAKVAELERALAKVAELERALGAAINQRNKAEQFANENADMVDKFVCLFQIANQRKRVRQCENRKLLAQLVEAQARLIAGDVYGQLDSVTYWKTRAEQAEADARALAELTVDEESPLTDAQRALIAKYTGDAKGN